MPVPSSPTGAPARQRARTRLDPQVRRELIVDAAERAFADREPSTVTLEEIAEEAGVSRALVYNYFGDKGGVIAAVYFRSFERLDARLGSALAHADDEHGRVRAIIAAYLRYAGDHAAAWRLVGSPDAVRHPSVLRARATRFDRMADAWGGTAEARLVARAVVGMLEAATLDWLDDPVLDVDAATEVLYRLLAGGLEALLDAPGEFRSGGSSTPQGV